jgi:hypothetical protein
MRVAARGHVVAVERARDTIGKDPRRAGACGNHVVHEPRRETRALGDRDGFAGRREVGGGEHVVDDLELRRIAGARSHDEDFARDRAQQRAAALDGFGAPESIIVIVPSAARCGPPDTGASIAVTPSRANRAANDAVSARRYGRAEQHDWLGVAPAIPSRPNSTSSICALSTTRTTTASHARASAAGEGWHAAPSLDARRALPNGMSRTWAAKPPRNKLRTTPMTHGAGADDADVHRYFAGGGSTGVRLAVAQRRRLVVDDEGELGAAAAQLHRPLL